MPSNPKNTRKCAVCRKHADKSELIRIVKTADGRIVVDADGKTQGRGAYVCKTAECLYVAKKKRVLNAAFHTAVADEVYDELDSQS